MKSEHLNIRVEEKLKEEFEVVASLNALKPSQMINQFMKKSVLEYQSSSPDQFRKAFDELKKEKNKQKSKHQRAV